ncbi:MAG: hypothetical protein AB7H43_15425, partial [Acidimicrobiia bacterium]
MIPVAATPEQMAWLAEKDGAVGEPCMIGGPEEGPEVIPCPAVLARVDGAPVIHVAWQLDE